MEGPLNQALIISRKFLRPYLHTLVSRSIALIAHDGNSKIIESFSSQVASFSFRLEVKSVFPTVRCRGTKITVSVMSTELQPSVLDKVGTKMYAPRFC